MLHPLAWFWLRAVIDWVQVVVHLNRPTHHRHVRTRLQAAGLVAGFVEHVDTSQDKPARVITVRVHDPVSPAAFMAALQHVAPPGSPPVNECDIQIVGLEIALDAYPKSNAERDNLSGAALHLFRHLAHPPAGTPRITEPGHYRAAGAAPRDTLQALVDGFTINMGAKTPEYAARCYVKRKDSKPGQSYAPLPQDQHRARLELTLRGTCLPFATVAQWKAYRFESLARNFAMVTDPAPAATPMGALLQDRMAETGAPLGKPMDAIKQAQKRRISRVGVRRDIALNQRIADALRALTRQAANAEIHENFNAAKLPSQRESHQTGHEVLNTLIPVVTTQDSTVANTAGTAPSNTPTNPVQQVTDRRTSAATHQAAPGAGQHGAHGRSRPP